MKLTTFGLTVFVGAALIIAGLHGQLDWVGTPGGHAAMGWLLLAVLVTVLACLGIRTAHRDRAAREAQEWADLDEWEAQMYAELSPWLDRDDDLPVRPITRAEMDRERLTTTVVPPSPAPAPSTWGWGQRLTPLEYDYAASYTGPSRVRYYLGEARPMAEVLTYAGAAAWTNHDFRAGLPLADPDVIDAIVPTSGGPRHALGSAAGTDTQRALWTSNTGAWPVVRELVGSSA